MKQFYYNLTIEGDLINLRLFINDTIENREAIKKIQEIIDKEVKKE